MKKLKFLGIALSFSLLVLLGSNASFSESKPEINVLFENVEALASSTEGESSVLYQTMAYCTPTRLTWACTTKKYAERCQKYACIVNY